MNVQRPLWPLIVLGVAVGFMLLRQDQYHVQPAKPASGPDLTPAFSQSSDSGTARRDADLFADLCAALADQIEYDGRLDVPRLQSGSQIDDLRRWAREYCCGGKSFAAKYPRLSESVKGYLDHELGTSGGPLDAAQRGKWVAAMRTLAECGHYAASRL